MRLRHAGGVVSVLAMSCAAYIGLGAQGAPVSRDPHTSQSAVLPAPQNFVVIDDMLFWPEQLGEPAPVSRTQSLPLDDRQRLGTWDAGVMARTTQIGYLNVTRDSGAFAVDTSQPTLIPHAPYESWSATMGRQPEPSAVDYEGLAFLYNVQLRDSTIRSPTESVRTRFDRGDFCWRWSGCTPST